MMEAGESVPARSCCAHTQCALGALTLHTASSIIRRDTPVSALVPGMHRGTDPRAYVLRDVPTQEEAYGTWQV